MHLFFQCPVAKAVWLASPWSVRWDNNHMASLEDYLSILAKLMGKLPIHREDQDKFLLFASLAFDTLWKFQNKVLFKGKMIALNDEVNALFTRFREFLCMPSKAKHSSTPNQTASSWFPPPNGFIKVNTNMALRDGEASLGLVSRNHLGKLVKVEVVREKIHSLEVAEATVILHAVHMAAEEGYSQVLCESDSNAVIQSITNPDMPSVHWSTFCFSRKIAEFCSRYRNIRFAWTPRNLNKLAYYMAEWGLSNTESSLVHLLSFSTEFTNILKQDCGDFHTQIDSLASYCICVNASFG